MNPETMSIFSPQLAGRFDALVEKYPLRRSALVPMLLYAQDEIGYLSDAVIHEVAERIGITELEVRNVATYYSMLRFRPAGKYNVQVCTNISCMLRGAYDLYERFQDELGIGHKGVTADGVFSLEEVECIGACCWAPAIQVNYDFHDELAPDSVPGILAQYRSKISTKGAQKKCLGWFRIPMKSRLSRSALARARLRSINILSWAAMRLRKNASPKARSGLSTR
jgi:NADH-quinone oxidoreductase subunit E